MSNQNQFLPFATGLGANTLPQSVYAALTALLGQGFQNGTADPAEFNTLMRQVSVVASMIGQVVADYSGSDALDDGNVAELETRFLAALAVIMQPLGVYFLTDTGTSNQVIATATPAPASLTGMRLGIVKKVGAGNTGAMTAKLFGASSPVALNDNTGAALSTGVVQASSLFMIAPNGSGELRIVSGTSSITNVSSLTANSGHAIAVQIGGEVDIDMTLNTTHDPAPSSTDLWIRQKADKTILNMTDAELIAWLNGALSFLTAAPAAGPGVAPGQFVVQTVSIASMGNPYTAGFREGMVATAAQIQTATWPGATSTGAMGIDSANTGWQAANFSPPNSGSVNGTMAGTWKLEHWVWKGSAVGFDYYYDLYWVRQP